MDEKQQRNRIAGHSKEVSEKTPLEIAWCIRKLGKAIPSGNYHYQVPYCFMWQVYDWGLCPTSSFVRLAVPILQFENQLHRQEAYAKHESVNLFPHSLGFGSQKILDLFS